MITQRLAEDRGHADHGWLDARHSFSFGSYHDPRQMGYGDLRVINEDRVVPGAGFATHGHRDMEIITYVLSGALEHKDSTGGEGVLHHGEVQVMSAGRGVRHSEKNPSSNEPLHLLQIWIEPNQLGIAPSYQQKPLDETALHRGFTVVVAPHGETAPFAMQQDARLLIAWPRSGASLEHTLNPARRYYLHVAVGEIVLGTRRLRAGDAVTVEQESALQLTAAADSELLLFDLPDR